MMNRKYINVRLSCLLAIGLLFAGAAAAQKTPAAAKVELNKATVEQLAKCPGLNATLAKAILEYRQKSGPFKTPEDLLKVKGMTKGVLDRLKPGVEKGVIVVTPSSASEDDEEEPSMKPSKC
jgi:competence ComEA-like helix-hairpin-helix protein